MTRSTCLILFRFSVRIHWDHTICIFLGLQNFFFFQTLAFTINLLKTEFSNTIRAPLKYFARRVYLALSFKIQPRVEIIKIYFRNLFVKRSICCLQFMFFTTIPYIPPFAMLSIDLKWNGVEGKYLFVNGTQGDWRMLLWCTLYYRRAQIVNFKQFISKNGHIVWRANKE